MPFPRVVARLNKRFTNRFIEPLVSRTSSFVMIEHVGRTSGTTYRTPINLFGCDGAYIASLTYGPNADWVKNVRAGPAVCERRGARYAISAAELVGRSEAWPCLPLLVRTALRIIRVHHFLRVSLSPLVTSQ